MKPKLAFADDHFHDECGVFGVFGHPEAANLAYLGMYALQHRGQESAGIVSSNGKSLISHRGMGLVADIFNSEVINRLEGTAAIGKQILVALQIWRDDVNAKGGLMGRPVELVFYDDQGNPANAAQIYSKLLDIDKVDLLIGPYSTNMVAPVIPILMQRGLTTIGILANAANSQFHYDRYFSMIPSGVLTSRYTWSQARR